MAKFAKMLLHEMFSPKWDKTALKQIAKFKPRNLWFWMKSRNFLPQYFPRYTEFGHKQLSILVAQWVYAHKFKQHTLTYFAVCASSLSWDSWCSKLCLQRQHFHTVWHTDTYKSTAISQCCADGTYSHLNRWEDQCRAYTLQHRYVHTPLCKLLHQGLPWIPTYVQQSSTVVQTHG